MLTITEYSDCDNRASHNSNRPATASRPYLKICRGCRLLEVLIASLRRVDTAFRADLEPEAKLSRAQQRQAALVGVAPPLDGVLQLAREPQRLQMSSYCFL